MLLCYYCVHNYFYTELDEEETEFVTIVCKSYRVNVDKHINMTNCKLVKTLILVVSKVMT